MVAEKTSPIFVGGTGRSGTTITARILGSHSRIHMVPIEVRFIVDPGGLCDLITGDTTLDEFSARMTGAWWHRKRHDGSTRGLHKIVERSLLDTALDQLREGSSCSPTNARRFVRRLLDPDTTVSGARTWVEMTPGNVLRAAELRMIFPDMKLIHVARDGRNVACSVAASTWGPNDPFVALEWWADRLLEAQRACQGLTPDQLLEVRMEDICSPVDGTIERLFAFVGDAPDQSAKEFVRKGVRPERAFLERWKSDLNSLAQAEFDRYYGRILALLAADGFPIDRWGLNEPRSATSAQ